jgi:GNAT superfamily N-acetyltransferase
MTSQLQIRVATEEDRKSIHHLLTSLAQWMNDNHINQWSFLLDGEDEELKEWIANGQTFIVEKEGQFVATFTILSEAGEWDRHLWGDDLPTKTAYLHRLAITPNYMKQGIGKSIIDWIESLDLERIRLDCVADNPKLNHFYQSNRFECMGITDDHCKYQKRIKKDLS